MKFDAATIAALALFLSTSACAPLAPTKTVDPALGPTNECRPPFCKYILEEDAPLEKRMRPGAKMLTGSNDGPTPNWKYEYKRSEADDEVEEALEKRMRPGAKMLTGSNDGPTPNWKYEY